MKARNIATIILSAILTCTIYAYFAFHAAKKYYVTVKISEIEDRIACSEELQKTILLNDRNHIYAIQLPMLDSGPIIRADLVCDKFISQLIQTWKASKQSTIGFELRSQQATDRESYLKEYRHVRSKFLEQECQTRKFCGLSMLNSPIKSCGAQRSSIEKIQPRLTIPNYEPIENVEISVFPFDSLADNIMRTIDRVNQSGKSEKIFASTMSYGNSLAQAWNDFFRENRQHVFLALDAALSFSTFQSSLLARAYSEHPSIYIVPIIGGGLFESIYHWKFVVPETSNYASLSGMNLSLPSRAQYLDLIYHFSDAEVVQELRSYYEQMLEHNCQRRDDYQCLVDFMVPTVSDQVLLKKMFDRSCELFLTRQSSSSAVAKYFLQPQLHDISYLLKTKIRQAKQEIVVVMHKFSDSSLMDELHSAQQRGIRVVVITGTHPRVKSSSLVKGLVDYDSLGNSDRGFSPHMKIVIFDQTELFFGTGNLSRNALSDSAELYAITKNQRAIDSTLAQVKNLLYLAGDQRYKNIESTLPPEQWLLIQRHYSSDQAQAAARDLQRVAQFIAPGKFVHDRLRKINAGARQILANCGLDRLQIIHEKDLLRCQATADIQTLDLATH